MSKQSKTDMSWTAFFVAFGILGFLCWMVH